MISYPVIELVKKLKEMSYPHQPEGIQPLTILCDNDEPRDVFIAPDCDKMQGLHCLDICRQLIPFESAVLVLDARGKIIPEEEFDAYKDKLKDYKDGDLYKLCEQGKAEEENIIELLILQEVSEEGLISAMTIEYKGVDGTIEWKDPVVMGDKQAGYIPDSLLEIMSAKYRGDELIETSLAKARKMGVPEDVINSEEFMNGLKAGPYSFLKQQGFGELDLERL